jgi:hypothetical protein
MICVAAVALVETASDVFAALVQGSAACCGVTKSGVIDATP